MKKNNDKYYIHFDTKKKYARCKIYIKDPDRVKSHGFYPFIHFEIKFKKYILIKDIGENGKKIERKEHKDKIRQIKYAAHIERFIYQHYGNLVNDKYNVKAKDKGINKVSTAYRNNFKGKSNIHFAKEVFEFIAKQKQVFIYLGDFSNFFDELEHAYLKERIQDVLGVRLLPDDHYAVFKNVTKYSYIKLEDIEKYIGTPNKKLRESNIQKYFDTAGFQEVKKRFLIKNEESYGIPQGSSISSVYSNVYMMEFDTKINNYVTSRKGMYRRYCDDFILIIPFENSNEIQAHADYVMEKTNEVPRLILQPDKTEQYIFKKDQERQISSIDNKKFVLNYLGFSFDGTIVKIRDKSIFKFYSRAYKKVRTVIRYKKTDKEKLILRKLFKIYTYLGDPKYGKGKGNFLTYARKAEEVFAQSTILQSKIHNQVRRHWKKIGERLKIKRD
jgi:hypothetical protein